MNIRTQNILTIAPVFLFVSVAVGALRYQMSSNDLVWGFKEEASAIAVSAAAHLSAEGSREILAGGEESGEQLTRYIQGIFSWEKAKAVFAYDSKGSLIFNFTPGITPENKPGLRTGPVPENHMREVLAGKHVVSEIQNEREAGDVLFAYSPLRDSSGAVLGVLGIETDARAVREKLAHILTGVVWGSVAMLFLGVSVALIISGIIKSRIALLNRAADAVAAGNFGRILRNGSIREINDLSNTFNTMNSILRDNSEKSKRSVAESELCRKPEDLIEVFNRSFLGEKDYRFSAGAVNYEISAFLSDPLNIRDFFDIVETDDRIFVFLGRIQNSQPEDSIVLRSAVQTLFRQELMTHGDPAKALEAAAGLFPVAEWHCIEADRQTQHGEVLHYSLCPFTGQPGRNPVKIGRHEPIMISTEGIEYKVPRAKKFFSKLKHLTPAQIRAEIGPVLRFEKQGATVIFGMV